MIIDWMKWGFGWIIAILLVGCGATSPHTATITPAPTKISASATPQPVAFVPFRLSVTPTATATITPTATQTSNIIPTPMTVSAELMQTLTPNSATTLPSTHTVRSGDSLSRVADLYNVTIADLMTVNVIMNAQTLQIGDVLVIPNADMLTATAPHLTDLEALEAQFLSLLPASYPGLVNGLTTDQYLVLSEEVINNIQTIYAHGQEMGRDPNAFTRIGDSTIEAPHFFYRFDSEPYHLGYFEYLQDTIDFYAGSFGHDSVGVIRGLHSSSVLDPMWTPSTCEAGENLLDCEFRLHNPSIIIIRLGSNDNNTPELTRENFSAIVDYCIEQGVVPILGTKADRFDDAEDSTNAIIRAVAEEHQVPLWDFDLLASTLPEHGLISDNIHLTIFYPHDWRLEQGFETGYGLHNLTGLIVLDEIRHILNTD